MLIPGKNLPSVREQVELCRNIASQLVSTENSRSKGATMVSSGDILFLRLCANSSYIQLNCVFICIHCDGVHSLHSELQGKERKSECKILFTHSSSLMSFLHPSLSVCLLVSLRHSFSSFCLSLSLSPSLVFVFHLLSFSNELKKHTLGKFLNVIRMNSELLKKKMMNLCAKS